MRVAVRLGGGPEEEKIWVATAAGAGGVDGGVAVMTNFTERTDQDFGRPGLAQRRSRSGYRGIKLRVSICVWIRAFGLTERRAGLLPATCR